MNIRVFGLGYVGGVGMGCPARLGHRMPGSKSEGIAW